MSIKKVTLIILLVLIIDQASKIYIKTHFQLFEDMEITSWFRLVFVENDGMAWGTRLNDIIPFMSAKTSKLVLTLFRIIAVTGIAIWLWSAIQRRRSGVLILSIALIFSGAVGNIIDSLFYGVLFSDSFGQVATFLPKGGGYASVFHGKVVDMLHFPIWTGTLPDQIPWIGGNTLSFFDPVFNIADVAITTGILMLLVFNRRAFN